MGARGPAPTPTRILQLNGSWRAGLRGNEVQFAAGAPECPAVLSGAAREEWGRLAKLLVAAGVLQVADLAMLAALCRTWGEWVRLTELSAGWNFAEESDRKQARLLAQTEDRLARLAAQFGLSPSSRTRVTPAAPPEAAKPKVATRPQTKLDRLGRPEDAPR